MRHSPLHHLLGALGLFLAAASPATAQDAAPASSESFLLLDDVRAMLDAHGDGVTAGLWLGNAGGETWLELDAYRIRPTASANKTFYLVELFDVCAGRLDETLPGADEVLDDPSHPAISHFTSSSGTRLGRLADALRDKLLEVGRAGVGTR